MGKEKVYIAIPVPDSVKSEFPTPDPHITLAFCPGPMEANTEAYVQAVTRLVLEAETPFEIRMRPGVEWFTSDQKGLKDKGVAHKGIHMASYARLALINERLVKGLKCLGVKTAIHETYTPHITLAYSKTRRYDGLVPESGFVADRAVVYGPSGEMVVPFGGGK